MRIAPGGRGLRSAEVRLEEQVCCKNEITTPVAAVAEIWPVLPICIYAESRSSYRLPYGKDHQ